MFDYLKQD